MLLALVLPKLLSRQWSPTLLTWPVSVSSRRGKGRVRIGPRGILRAMSGDSGCRSHSAPLRLSFPDSSYLIWGKVALGSARAATPSSRALSGDTRPLTPM